MFLERLARTLLPLSEGGEVFPESAEQKTKAVFPSRFRG